uniref:Uncharacterized protein n=1 Tax=Aegilops tauschii subsp. strangulata TaxID=200361 RepID=A0A453QYV9_AEGTS
MNSYYYYLEDSRQWFWWSGGWRKTNDGRRYPAVNIVILTEVSFDYVFGRKPLTEPPQDSSPGTVISIKDMEEWQSRWDNSARYNKLVLGVCVLRQEFHTVQGHGQAVGETRQAV